MSIKIQLRGNCQRCGALQAATFGGVAHHGYTVKNGWFEGVCNGHGYPPIQVRRDTADHMIAAVRADVADLERKLPLMKAGRILPALAAGKLIIGGPKSGTREKIPFAEADQFAQRDAVKAMLWSTESRIRAGTSFAKDFEALVERVHGTPLIEVKLPAPAERISKGEQRLSESGKVLTAAYQERARIYYDWPSVQTDGTVKMRRAWQGVTAWRKLAPVSAALDRP